MATTETTQLDEQAIDCLEGLALEASVDQHVMQRVHRDGRLIPDYSTDLVQAFRVAQHMAVRLFQRCKGEQGHLDDDELNSLTLAQCSSIETDGAWFAAFQVFDPWPEDFEPEHIQGLRAVALARTPQVAICRAALKAVLLVKP